MPNHFHLVVETPQPNLVAGMKWFLGTYTGRFNRRHKLFGHLFSGRYKSLVVDGSGNGSVEELKARRKGDAFKVRLAGQLRAQTTVTAAWIAEHLHMGTRGHLTHLLHHRGKEAH